MRILIYGLNYAPELTGIGKYTAEMAEWLATRDEVRVVAAPPYYPEWRVAEGYSSRQYRRETMEGVDLWRCPIWVPPRPSGLKRLLHLASFAISSFPVLMRQVLWRPEIVMVIEPPFFCAPTAWLSARLSGGRAWLHVQDFEIDAAFELGLLPAGSIQRLITRLESWLMRRFDRVSCISSAMRHRLEIKGVDGDRAILFPNWVDTEQIRPDRPGAMELKQALGIPSDKKVLLYSGNMGEKQGLDIVLDAAKIVAEHPDLLFVLCGEGAAKQHLMQKAGDLPNVVFMPLQPLERLNSLLNLADIHLLPQREDVADLVMPSKLTGILACGGAVITTAFQDTELASVVQAAGGVVTRPGDAEQFADAIFMLAADEEQRRRMGAQARAYAIEHLSKSAILEQLHRRMRAASQRQPLPIF